MFPILVSAFDVSTAAYERLLPVVSAMYLYLNDIIYEISIEREILSASRNETIHRFCVRECIIKQKPRGS